MGELLIRIQKHIFLITLSAACLLGISMAYLGSVLTEYFLQSAQADVVETRKPSRGNEATAARKFRSFSDFEEIITGGFVRDSGASMAAGAPTEGADASPITVIGLLAGNPRWAYVSLMVEGKDDVQEHRVGETVAGHKILRINSNSVTVSRGGQSFEILIGEKSSEAKVTDTAPPAGDAQKSTISRTKLKQLMKDEKTLRQARVAPFLHKGKMRGVRVLSIPPNHVFYKLGARPGDIIRRFNGDKLDSTAKLIEIYQKLADLPRVVVDVERGGKIQTFEFVITN